MRLTGMNHPTCSPRRLQRGFTLVELVMVIVIMGVIGGIVAVFMRSPIEAYIATSRRAALTDVADTAIRRVARDIRRALPNTLRSNRASCIEFMPTKVGGALPGGGKSQRGRQQPGLFRTRQHVKHAGQQQRLASSLPDCRW